MGANRKGLLVTVIAATMLLIALQMASGVWLFATKLTFEPTRIAAAYIGDPEAFIAGKTVVGILQTSLPHVVAMGTIALLMAHLLPHCGVSQGRIGLLTAAMYAGAAGEVATPFLIVSVSPLFAWGKLVSFILFEAGIVVTLISVLVSASKKHSL